MLEVHKCAVVDTALVFIYIYECSCQTSCEGQIHWTRLMFPVEVEDVTVHHMKPVTYDAHGPNVFNDVEIFFNTWQRHSTD